MGDETKRRLEQAAETSPADDHNGRRYGHGAAMPTSMPAAVPAAMEPSATDGDSNRNDARTDAWTSHARAHSRWRGSASRTGTEATTRSEHYEG